MFDSIQSIPVSVTRISVTKSGVAHLKKEVKKVSREIETQQIVSTAIDLLMTLQVPSKFANYQKLLEKIFPIFDLQKEILLQYLQKQPEIKPEWTAALIKTINQQITTLPPRKKTLIQKRFGVPKGTPHTFQELAEKDGVTRERIRLAEKITLHLTAQLPIFKFISESLQEIWGEKCITKPLDGS